MLKTIRLYHYILISLFLILIVLPAHAGPPMPTILTLSATASAEVAPDRFFINLRAEAQGTTAASAQAAVNERMAAAVAKAKEAAAVRASTGGTYVAEERSAGVAPVFHARQSLTLASDDVAAALDLAALLEKDGLVSSGADARLSPEKMRTIRQDLASQAIERLGEDVRRAAADLDADISGYRSVRILPEAVPGPRPLRALPRGALASPADTAPVFQPDEQTVSVVVEAEVLLLQRSGPR